MDGCLGAVGGSAELISVPGRGAATGQAWRPRLDELGGARRVRLGAPTWRRLTLDEVAGLVGRAR